MSSLEMGVTRVPEAEASMKGLKLALSTSHLGTPDQKSLKVVAVGEGAQLRNAEQLNPSPFDLRLLSELAPHWLYIQDVGESDRIF